MRAWTLAIVVALTACGGASAPQPKGASAPATQSGGAFNEHDRTTLVDEHNRVRALVSKAPLQWSNRLAAFAQAWVNHLAATDCRMRHRPHEGEWAQQYGENLFAGTAGFYKPADAVTAWESERQFYHGQPIGEGDFGAYGHYTQIIWGDTERVGCAQVVCNGMLIIACNYDPPGNFIGRTP